MLSHFLPVSFVMALSITQQFQALLDEAGCSADLSAWLRARGVTTPHLMANIGALRQDVLDFLATPFITGTTIDGVAHKATTPDVIVIACLSALWNNYVTGFRDQSETAGDSSTCSANCRRSRDFCGRCTLESALYVGCRSVDDTDQ